MIYVPITADGDRPRVEGCSRRAKSTLPARPVAADAATHIVSDLTAAQSMISPDKID
jgi:hypothetical protein